MSKYTTMTMLNQSENDLCILKKTMVEWPEDTSVEVIDLSGLHLLRGDSYWSKIEKYPNLRKVIMHGCDKDTVATVIHECYFNFRRKMEFEHDISWEKGNELRLRTRSDVAGEPLCQTWGNDYVNFQFLAYRETCYLNVFNENIEEGSEITLIVYHPVYCKVGDTFNIGLPVVEDDWEHYDYAVLRLLEILMQYGGDYAIVRVKVVRTGTYRDFLLKEFSCPDHYDYCPPEDDGEADISYYDGEKGVFSIYGSLGGGDMCEEHQIVTIDGIDHWVSVEFKSFHSHIVMFGDVILGPHLLCPYE